MKVAPEPKFTIEKLQEIEGSKAGFTKSELTGKDGQTVDYEIIVKNTGNVTLKFKPLSDPACEGISPSGEVTLTEGASQTYTCHHVLSGSGAYRNQASIEANEGAGSQSSNEVIVNIANEPKFTIEKLQEIEGSKAGFTKSELTGKDGQTVDYEVIVKNTGNVGLKFKPLVDANCAGISPSGEVTIAAGGSQTYTCHHELTGLGSYGNTASIEDPETAETSNEVVVKITAEPSFTIEKLQKIEGEASFTMLPLSGKDGETVEYEIVVKNTGNVSLKFKPLVDANCAGISPSGEVTIAAGGSQTYTCHHELTGSGTYGNTASVEGNEGTGTKTSNEVVVNITAESSFTIEKLQEIEGSKAGFVKTKLSGEIGQTVDYKIVVKNTGNVSLKFKPLVDANCTGISPSGEVTVAAGGEQTYTCHHELTAVGVYGNEASIEGNEGTGTKTSNKVEVEVAAKPSFTIEKLQEIEGSKAGFTKSELTGKDGQTVDYEIIVKNTGNVSLKFKPLSDANCAGISPSGEVTIAAGGSQTYTCHHELTGSGTYGNTASVEGNEGTGTKTSNEVIVKITAEPSFTIEKLQEIEGSKAGFVKTELTGKDGQTVDYEVIVKNTGNVSLKFKPLSDTKCTGISPSGEVTIAAGGSQTYTCHHELTGSGTYGNTASIEGNEGTGSKTSNEVVVKITAEPSFTIEKLQEIEGSKAGFVKTKLSGEIGQTVDYKVVVKNTGNVSLKFKPLSDANCTGISPSGEVTVAAGGEQTYTCHHELTAVGVYSNEASIEGNEGTGTKTSNKVEVEVAAKPSFTIEKLQEIEGSKAGFVKTELTGKDGQTVDYEVIVKNTGNVSLKFKPLVDANCAGISPSGEVTIAAGGSQTYTCHHELTGSGTYGNTASIEGNEGTGSKTSNEVVVKITAEPSFTIEKLQEIEGSKAGFVKTKLSGEIGQTVDYKVVVKNTGNVSLKFKPLSDANCTGISPSGEVTVAAGGEQTYTCHHELTAVGVYSNEASIEGNEGTGTKTSNKVEVEVAAKPSFTIEKLQEIEGSKAGFVKTELTGKDGQTVDYEVIVKNTGNVSLKFKPLSDTKCTGISPSGEVTIAAGGSQTYTCHHELTGSGTYGNTASIEGNEGTGSKTSNEVVVKITAEPSFTIEKLQEIEGSKAGFVKTELSGKDGQTVDYEVIVKNTGNVSLKFKPLSDTKCTGISPSGEVTIAAGGSQTYTCHHELTGSGTYGNTASIEGNEGTGTKTSNEVVVKITAEPSFTIEKFQEIEGSMTGFVKTELSSEIGQTVDYRIVVKNTGNVTLKFSKLTDAKCEGIAPSTEVTITAGGEQVYTCSHKLTASGAYTNTATITGNEGTGSKTSNEVVVNVAEPATCPKDAIVSNFNGTKVEPGEWVYFNAVINPHNTGAGDTIKFTKQKITVKLHNGEVIKLEAPNSTIKFENIAQGTTEFVGGEWVTKVPAKFTDNIFLGALDWHIPAGVQIAQAEPVTWEGDFTDAPPGFELQWQWAAAVYSTLPANYNELEVKPLHSTSEDKYHNGDQAGTPENEVVQENHTEGARGGGGSNYTGSYTNTGSCPDPPEGPTEGNPYATQEEEPVWLPWPGE